MHKNIKLHCDKIKIISYYFLFFFLFLTGCATFGQMNDGLRALSKHSEQEAFTVLGYPDGKQEFGRKTIYIWSTHNQSAYLAYTPSITSGNIGGIPFSTTTNTYSTETIEGECKIKAIVDNGTIESWEYEGNIAGCKWYIKRLNDYMKSREKHN